MKRLHLFLTTFLFIPFFAFAQTPQLIKDIAVTPNAAESSRADNLTKIGNTIFFFADDGTANGYELWRTDGTTAGTQLIQNVNTSTTDGQSVFSNPFSNVIELNGEAYWLSLELTSIQSEYDLKLWKAGQSGGATLVKQLDITRFRQFKIEVVNNIMYWIIGTEAIWQSDGTTAGTVRFLQSTDTNFDHFLDLKKVATNLFFTRETIDINSQFDNRIDIWKKDGITGAVGIHKNAVGESPVDCGLYNAVLLDYSGTLGHTLPGTSMCSYDSRLDIDGFTPFSINHAPISSQGIISPVIKDNKIFFLQYTLPLGEEFVLMSSDGGQLQTIKNVGRANFINRAIDKLSNGDLIILTGGGLWRSDGTTAGTQLIKSFDSGFNVVGPKLLTRNGADGYIFVAVENGVTALWKVDVSGTNVTKIVDIHSTSQNRFDSYHVDELVICGNEIIYTGDDGQRGVELWKVDLNPTPPPICDNNLSNNSGFENGFTGWETFGNATLTTDTNTGSNAAEIQQGGVRILQVLPAEPGKEYTASAQVKTNPINEAATVRIKFLSSTWQPLDDYGRSLRISGDYQEMDLTRTAPPNTSWIEVSYFSSSQATVLVDDVCITEGGINPTCSITATINNILCIDSGTSNNPSDDEFSFDLMATTTGIGTSFQQTLSNRSGVSIGNYDTRISFGGFSISAGSFTITLTDIGDSNCTTNITVNPPAPCSNGPGTGCGIDKSITQFTGIPNNRGVSATENSDGSFSARVSDFTFATGYSQRTFEADESGAFLSQGNIGLVPTGFNPIEGGYYTSQFNSGEMTINFFDYSGNQTQKTVNFPPTVPNVSNFLLKKLNDGYVGTGIYDNSNGQGQFANYAFKVDDNFNIVWFKGYTFPVNGGSNYRHLMVANDGGHYFLNSTSNDYSLVKTNSSGAFLWSRGASASALITFYGISESPDGQCVYTTDISASIRSSNQFANFRKYSATGQELWTRAGAGANSTYSPSILALDDGAVIAFTIGTSFANQTPVFNYKKLNEAAISVWERTKENVTLQVDMQTADGGFLFSGTNNIGVPHLLKTTSNGDVTPVCQTNTAAELTIIGNPCTNDFPQQGETVSVDFTIKNTGGSASSAQTIYLYRAKSCRFCSPINLGNVAVPALQPNEEITLTVSGIDNGMIPGSYNVLGILVPHVYFGYFLSDEVAQFPNNLKDIDFYCKKFNSDISINVTSVNPEYNGTGVISFKLTARNNGSEMAHNVAVHFLDQIPLFNVSLGSVVTTSNAVLKSTSLGVQWVIPKLQVGVGQEATITYNILGPGQQSTLPDDFTVNATISSGHNTDTNTANDADSATFVKTGVPNGGDLVLIATGDPTIAQWSNGTALFEVTNQSGFVFENVKVQLNFDSNIRLVGGNEYTSSVGTTLEQSWTNNPVWNIGTVSAGNVKTISLNVYSITNTPMEIYGQISEATGNDVTSTPGNGTPPIVNEDDEVLWQINGGGPTGLPELGIASVTTNGRTFNPGDIFTYSIAAGNNGDADASGDFTIKAYISTDQVISSDDIQDGTIQTGNFAEGVFFPDIPGATTIPSNLATGDYYLILKIDADDQITEQNENNNQTALPITIIGSNPTPPCPGNLLTNPGFENGLNNWTDGNVGAFSVTTDSNSGSQAIQLSGSSAAKIMQNLTNVQGGAFRMTFWGKKMGLGESNGVFISDTGGGIANPVDESTGFREYTSEARTSNLPTDFQDFEVFFTKASGAGTFIVDDVCLQKIDIPMAGVDLELSFEQLNNVPAQWAFFPVTLIVKNNGLDMARDIKVSFERPDQVIYKGGDEFTASQGTFNYYSDEIWNVGALGRGMSASLTINYFRLSGSSFTAFAQVSDVNQTDSDSTPGNGSCCTANEDDEAVLQIGNSANSVNNRSAVAENLGNEVFAIVGANPNPTTGQFNIEVYANENQISEITVVDILGKPIFRKEVELKEGHNSIPIDLENRGAGMMVVKMTPFHPYMRQIRVMKVRD